MASRKSATHWASLAAEHVETECPSKTKKHLESQPKPCSQLVHCGDSHCQGAGFAGTSAFQNLLLKPVVEEEMFAMERMQKIITLVFEEATAYSREQTKLQFSKIPQS